MSEILDQIALEAGAIESEQDAAARAAAGEPEPAQVDPAESWAQIPMMVGSLLSIAMPELKQAYTPENCMNWGAAMVPLAEKYGWDGNSVLARFAPEIGVVVASLPLVLPTVAAIKARRPIDVPAREVKDPPEPDAKVDQMPQGGGCVDPS